MNGITSPAPAPMSSALTPIGTRRRRISGGTGSNNPPRARASVTRSPRSASTPASDTSAPGRQRDAVGDDETRGAQRRRERHEALRDPAAEEAPGDRGHERDGEE